MKTAKWRRLKKNDEVGVVKDEVEEVKRGEGG